MNTTAEKILYLNETKIAIKDAIVAKGVEVADDASFRSYAERIAEIETKTPLQEKTMDITENGSYEATPDEGYALGKVTANVEIVPVIEALEVTENGTYEVAEGIDGYGPVVVSVSSGGGEVEPIVLTGSCSYACAGAIGGNYIKLFGNTISTSGLTATDCMFYKNTATKIPFEININNSSYRNMASMFQGCEYLTEPPKVNNAYPNGLSKLFYMCYRLREIPEDWVDSWNFDRMHTYTYADFGSLFYECCSLRKISATFLAEMHSTSSNYSPCNFLCYRCYSLDELVNMPIGNAVYSNNVFGNALTQCHRLKNFTFATNEDGSAKTANWKNQAINFNTYIGYGQWDSSFLDYNSGITADKKVTDNASYQALKDDPDWYTLSSDYSRYNHDSAVNTINSLPDTSAYLAANGGTNTIKFNGAAGSATDGGAINTLTEEEIAVATAKGWTVTLV
jgi:hypothetical protein